MLHHYVEKNFAVNFMLMRVIGLYPLDKYKKWYKFYGYFVYFTVLVPFPILGFVYLYLRKETDITEIAYNGLVLIEAACFAVKFFPFLKHAERIRKCVQYLDSVKLLELNPSQQEIMEECAQTARRNTKLFIGGCIVGVLNGCLNPLYSEKQFLPIKIWLPFSLVETSVGYYLAYVYVSMSIIYCGLSTGPIDPLIGSLPYYASGQLKVLKDYLQHLQKYVNENVDDGYKHLSKDQIMYNMIKRCIKHYKAIDYFYKEYESCFSLTVFSQFIVSSVVFGFCCVYLSKLPFLSVDFFIMTGYFYVTVLQIYFYCYYGTTLILESDSLNTSIYMGKWYDYSLKSQKALIILMEYSKKPMTLTAGKIFELSLDTFTTIIKRSYSVLALLKNY